MLPNHAPLVVAEQFALLEAAFPGRIDLGIGRAPWQRPGHQLGAPARWRRGRGGRGQPVPRARRQRHRDDGPGRRGARGQRPDLRAPRDAGGPWPTTGVAARLLRLLGPAGRVDGAAVRLRAPLLRQRHPRGARALPQQFRPTDEVAEPTTFLTVNVCVAETRRRPSGSRARSCSRWSRCAPGASSRAQLSVEAAAERPAARRARAPVRRDAGPLGDRHARERPLARLAELAATYAVDEVMVHPVAGSSADADPGPGRDPRAHPRAARGGARPPSGGVGRT